MSAYDTNSHWLNDEQLCGVGLMGRVDPVSASGASYIDPRTFFREDSLTMQLSKQNLITRILGTILMTVVLSSCSALQPNPDPTPTPAAPTSAIGACTQQQMASITAGNDAAQPFPADSIGALMAAQAHYAITIAEYHACLASH